MVFSAFVVGRAICFLAIVSMMRSFTLVTSPMLLNNIPLLIDFQLELRVGSQTMFGFETKWTCFIVGFVADSSDFCPFGTIVISCSSINK